MEASAPPTIRRPRYRCLAWSFKIKTFRSRRKEFEATTIHSADGIKDGIHAYGFDFANLGHQFTEPTFRETTFQKPTKVFLGEVHDRNPCRRVGLDTEFTKRDPRFPYLDKEIPKVVAVDFSEIRHRSRLEFRALWRRHLGTVRLERGFNLALEPRIKLVLRRNFH